MEKNDFLLFNEIIYHIHTCKDLDELKRTILAQVKLIIPYTYASIMRTSVDPETKTIHHSDPFCVPDDFSILENTWIERNYQDEGLWISHAPESIVVRSSELMGDENRLSTVTYRELYQQYNIYDMLYMNLTYEHQVMALLTLYRTRADGVFTDQEAFFLRALSNHIDFAYYTQTQKAQTFHPEGRTMDQISDEYHLTRREEEILGLVFQDMNNDEILERITISKHTLLKHLQNLYRKCGVTSRWDLLKIKG